MPLNYQFGFKNANGQNILLYCFISIFCISFCIYTTNGVHLSDLENEKTISVDNEEIIRRQSVIESYLKETNNVQNDWIETYHASLLESSTLALRKAKHESSLKTENEIPITLPLSYPFHNVDLTVHNEMNFDNNRKNEIKSFKKATNSVLKQPCTVDKNDEENKESLRNNNDQTYNFNLSKKHSKTNSSAAKKLRKSRANSISKSNKRHILPKTAIRDIDGNNYSNCEKYNTSIDEFNKSHSKTKYPNMFKNCGFRLDEFKNISINTDKFIEIIIMNSKFTSEKYFINSASLTLTELQKLKKNLAYLSFLQQNKNSVYSVNRMNIIDSISKLTPLDKQDKFTENNYQQLCKFSNSNDKIFIESVQDKVNLKKSAVEFQKRVSHKLNHEENITPNNVEHSSVLRSIDNKKFVSNNIANNDFSHDSEVLRRKKLINSYLSTLNIDQKNWIETYDFSNLESKPEKDIFPISFNDNFKERKNSYNLQKTSEQPNEISKVYFHERSYIIRWINKLHNKIKDSQCGYCSHNIFISSESLKILERLSQEFDIIMFDEFVNSIISNATMNNNIANILYFYYENMFSISFLSLKYPMIYVVVVLLLFGCILLYCLFSETVLKKNFTLYKIIFIFLKHYKWIIIFLLCSSIYLHGNKMYQQKIAKKHQVLSRVVPSYCENILAHESGILAHLKEYVRWWWHDEDCKRYYEAVMVDPSAEISPVSVFTDLFSDSIFHMLEPFGRNMNSFYKTLTKDVSFFQQFIITFFTIPFLIIIFCFSLLLLAVCWNYRVNLPFHLGSIGPTEFSVGSRVQEVKEKESSFFEDFNTSYIVSQINYNNKNENKNHIEDVILKENTFIIKSEQLKLDPSKYCILKVSRTRHNSI